MRFMMMVKSKERSAPPPPALMEAIAKISEDAARAGTMVGGGGLGPTALGASVRVANGRITVTDGPFSEAKEVLGGYAEFELPSKEAAIEAAVKFMELHRLHWPGWEGETEVRQMFGPQDAGHCAEQHRRVAAAAADSAKTAHV